MMLPVRGVMSTAGTVRQRIVCFLQKEETNNSALLGDSAVRVSSLEQEACIQHETPYCKFIIKQMF